MFLNINPWMQFYDLGDRKEIPLSYADHITFRDCEAVCQKYLHVAPKEDQYRLSDFTFQRINVQTRDPGAAGSREGLQAVFHDLRTEDVHVTLTEE